MQNNNGFENARKTDGSSILRKSMYVGVHLQILLCSFITQLKDECKSQ